MTKCLLSTGMHYNISVWRQHQTVRIVCPLLIYYTPGGSSVVTVTQSFKFRRPIQNVQHGEN